MIESLLCRKIRKGKKMKKEAKNWGGNKKRRRKNGRPLKKTCGKGLTQLCVELGNKNVGKMLEKTPGIISAWKKGNLAAGK